MALRKGHRFVAGVDESGRGPLAGPVVAAAVILLDHDFENKIDDSKRLTPRLRALAYNEIMGKSVYSVARIGQKVIDRVNIFNATRMAMEKAVNGLDIKPDFLLIDGRLRLSIPCESRSIIRGDRQSISIACASIIAKVYRDSIMEKIHARYPRYGFTRHKGYGTIFHMRALEKYGPSPVHRFTFKPVKEALKR